MTRIPSLCLVGKQEHLRAVPTEEAKVCRHSFLYPINTTSAENSLSFIETSALDASNVEADDSQWYVIYVICFLRNFFFG